MKNPINHIKHLMKDPLNSIAEVEARKKEIMPWLFGSIGVAVVFCILGNFVSFLTIFGLVGVFATMFFGFLLFIANKVKARFKALTCEGCNTLIEIKTQEDFDTYVSYEIVSHGATFDGISHPSSSDGIVSSVTAKASASATVIITIKCPNCGKIKCLKYSISPFKCVAEEKKVPVLGLEAVKTRLQNDVVKVVDEYNDPATRNKIPFTVQSIHHPNFENKDKLGASGAKESYGSVTITYHRTVEELVEGYFVRNELNGTIKAIEEKSESK